MHTNWERTFLGNCSDIILGGTPKTKEPSYWDGNIPWASIIDFNVYKKIFVTEKTITQAGLDNSNTKLLRKGDIIISARGTVGKTVVCGKPMAFNQSCYALRSKSTRLHQDFLYYLINHHVFQLRKKATGGVFDTIVTDTLRNLEIQLPSATTQRKIASILSAYDDLIENNTRRIKILEEMAQRLYREWFVYFRFPGHEKVKMVESELGPIPEGWEVKKIGDVIELAYGKALKAEVRHGGNIPVYGSGGVVGYHNESLVNGPGIIVGRKGNVGSIFWCDYNFYPIDTVFFVKTDIALHYVYFNLQYQNFSNTDAAVPGLKRSLAYLNIFLLPEKSLLCEFQKTIEVVFKQLKSLRKKNSNLRKTRDLLLPKLISGKLDVEDIDIETGALDA